MMEEIERNLIWTYKAYLKKRQISMNAISFYMRIFQPVYNRAVEKETTVQQFLFKHVCTGIEKTMKWWNALKAVRGIKQWELEG